MVYLRLTLYFPEQAVFLIQKGFDFGEIMEMIGESGLNGYNHLFCH
jgi:hypothetical protein